MKLFIVYILAIFSFSVSADISDSPKLSGYGKFESYTFNDALPFNILKEFSCYPDDGQPNWAVSSDGTLGDSVDNISLTMVYHYNHPNPDYVHYKKTYAYGGCQLEDVVINEYGQLQSEYSCLDGEFQFSVPEIDNYPEVDIWDGSGKDIKVNYLFKGFYNRKWPRRDVKMSCKQKVEYSDYIKS